MIDALALSLSRIGIQAMVAGRSTLSAPWGFRVPIGRDGRPLMPVAPGERTQPKLQAPGGCLYVVLSGGCLFESDFGSVQLEPGDLLFMTVSASHQLRDCGSSPVRPIWELAPPPVFPAAGTAGVPRGPMGLHVAGGGPETQLLQAILFFADGVGLEREDIPPILHIRASAADTPPWVPDLVTVLVSESERGMAASALVASRMIQTLFDLAVMIERGQRTLGDLPRRDRRIERVISVLELHSDQSWTVAELAAIAGMSRTAFAALFAAEAGMPPLKYLARCRMKRACRMLRSGEDSIKRIALATGYVSEPAFFAAFKASEGMTPSAYRALHQRGPAGLRSPWMAEAGAP